MLTKSKDYTNGLTRLDYILSRLLLTYRKGTDPLLNAPVLSIGNFGITLFITKNRKDAFTTPSGEHRLFFCPDFSEKEIEEFGEILMWKLIDSGYFAYIRELSNRGERLFNILLVRHGWGKRIIKKRIEIWENIPSRKFISNRFAEILNEFSIPEIISRWPGMFDYLT